MTPVTTAPPVDLDPLSLVRGELELVEAELLAHSESRVDGITAIGRYLQQSGGKRIRPALVLLTGQLCGCPKRPRLRLAAVVEMIHAATLVHDDIIDEAATRRGRPSANVRWGNSMCVLAGDWLYMQAFRVALGERNFAVLDALIGLTQTMVEGELMQLEMQASVVTAAQHLDLIERKTARLFEVGCQLGALIAGAPETEVTALGAFGRHLGLAFQMMDDILDFTGAAETLGKPVGNDLREGKMTLPAIYANAAAAPAERECLARVMRDGNYNHVGFDQVREILARHGALDRARADCQTEAEAALDALAVFPASTWRSALESLPRLVIERNR